MSQIISNLGDAALALIIIAGFGLFIWARIKRKSMGEIFNGMLAYFSPKERTVVRRKSMKQI